MSADAYAVVRVDELDCTYEPRPWPFAARHAAQIDAHWAAKTAVKPKLFNGRVLVQHRGDVVEEGGRRIFRGAYLEAEFKAFMAWRDFGHPDHSVRNCFALAALQASDGAFIVGQMGDHTASAGRVYFPAGTPDPQDVRDGKVDLAGSVLRELAEETGLQAAEVAPAAGWTLLVGSFRIACVRIVRSPLAAADLVARIDAFLAADPEPELARVHIVRSEADTRGFDMPQFMSAYFAEVLPLSPDSHGAGAMPPP